MGSSATFNNGEMLTLYPGQHLIVYTTGAILIANSIYYDITGVTSASMLPTLELITRGDGGADINIVNDVTHLSGNFIDEGVSSEIDDCVSSAGQPISSNYFFYDPVSSAQVPRTDTCGYNLVVEGSFLANDVELHRTATTTGAPSSLHLASSGEAIGSNSAAEEFDYSPLDWLVPVQSATPAVQSISSLPPIL
jgi:hypothetical protein